MAPPDERVLRRLKLSDLRLFHAVVQSGGMAKAAAQLHISQPAVSKAIAALEHTLGVRLLDRGPLGVEPTVYGRTLLDGGLAVFDELKQSLRRIEFLTDPGAGELRIGCSEPLAAGLVAAVIGALSHEHPRASFHVVTGDPASLAERELRRRAIELALVPTAGLDAAPDLDAQVLFDDRQVVMAGPQSRWLRRRKLGLADLVDEPWLLPPPDTVIGASIAATFRAAGLEPPRAHVISFSIPLCHQLMATQRFLAMLPISMARLGRELPLRVLNVAIPGIARPTGIVTLKKRMLSPLARLFAERARQLAKPLA